MSPQNICLKRTQISGDSAQSGHQRPFARELQNRTYAHLLLGVAWESAQGAHSIAIAFNCTPGQAWPGEPVIRPCITANGAPVSPMSLSLRESAARLLSFFHGGRVTPAVPFMGPPGPLRLRLLGPLTPCRLLRSGYLITGSASWLPAHGAFAGTWRTRRACQCAPCIGSPQSAHGRAGCGGRHVDDVIMIAAKIASRIECS
jgi:hypothetical protein